MSWPAAFPFWVGCLKHFHPSRFTALQQVPVVLAHPGQHRSQGLPVCPVCLGFIQALSAGFTPLAVPLPDACCLPLTSLRTCGLFQATLPFVRRRTETKHTWATKTIHYPCHPHTIRGGLTRVDGLEDLSPLRLHARPMSKRPIKRTPR